MRFRNISNWEDPTRDSLLLYFAQRLDELTFEYTLDSYRSPTLNAPFLIGECLKAISSHETRGLPASSVLHILDETEERLRDNVVVKALLSIRLENYLSFNRDDLNSIKSRLRVLRQELEPRTYALKCFQLIKHRIGTSEKRQIDFLASEMVTTLQNLKVSAFHINSTVREFFFGTRTISGAEDLDDFFREVFPHHHTFKICLTIETPLHHLKPQILSVFDITLSDKLPDEFKKQAGRGALSKRSAAANYLLVEKVSAPDRYSAIEVAKKRIRRVHDLFGLFHHKEAFRISEHASAIQTCCSGVTSTVKTSVNRMHFVSDNKPEQAAVKVDHLIRNLNLPKGSDKNKFFQILDFHGLSIKTSDIENQLLNLWTCPETLVPAKPSNSIISNVASGALPFIGLRYFRRLFETVTFDIVRWDRRALGKILHKVDNIDELDLVEKVFYLTCVTNNEAHLAELFAKLQNFELLRYRLYSLHQIFTSTSRTVAALERHQRRVEWQLHRIYRTRNSIIHSGNVPPFTANLVANAHDYFDQIFALSCEFCSGTNGFSTYTDCFEYTGWLFDQYRDDLKNASGPSVDTVNKILWKKLRAPDKADFFRQVEVDS